MAIFEESRDPPGLAHVDYTSGELARFEGEHARAEELYEAGCSRWTDRAHAAP